MASWHPDNERDERRELAELERDEADEVREQERAERFWFMGWPNEGIGSHGTATNRSTR